MPVPGIISSSPLAPSPTRLRAGSLFIHPQIAANRFHILVAAAREAKHDRLVLAVVGATFISSAKPLAYTFSTLRRRIGTADSEWAE